MSHYKANLRDIEFNLFEVFGCGDRLGSGPYAELDADTTKEILQAVHAGQVNAGFTTPGYNTGVLGNKAAIFSAVPFGPDAPELLAWVYYGDGRTLSISGGVRPSWPGQNGQAPSPLVSSTLTSYSSGRRLRSGASVTSNRASRSSGRVMLPE